MGVKKRKNCKQENTSDVVYEQSTDQSIKPPNKWRDWIISTLIIAKELHKSTGFYFSYNQIIKRHGK